MNNGNKNSRTEIDKLLELRLKKLEKKVTFFGWFIIYTLLVGFDAPSYLQYFIGGVAAWNFIDFMICDVDAIKVEEENRNDP